VAVFNAKTDAAAAIRKWREKQKFQK